MTTTPNHHSLQSVQICKTTGISGNYNSVILTYTTAYEIDGMSQVKEVLQQFPVKKYLKSFPQKEYQEAITPENQWRVEALDTLVDWLNAYGRGEAEMNNEGFKIVMLMAESLIYGKNGRLKVFEEVEGVKDSGKIGKVGNAEKKREPVEIHPALPFTSLEVIAQGKDTLALSPAVCTLLTEAYQTQQSEFPSLQNLRYELNPDKPFHPDSFFLCWELSNDSNRMIGMWYSAQRDRFEFMHEQGEKTAQEMKDVVREYFRESVEEERQLLRERSTEKEERE